MRETQDKREDGLRTHETFLSWLLSDTFNGANVVKRDTVPAEQSTMHNEVALLAIWR